MPDAIPRDMPDLLKDAILSILLDVAAEQEEGLGFNVRRDQLHPIAAEDLPLINIWGPETRSDEGSSSTRTQQHEVAVINLDLYTRGEEQPDEIDFITADQAAVARLDYLRAQVKHGIYRLINADLGFPAGTIARKRWPGWQMFQTELKMPAEAIVGGRLTLEIEYVWEPEDLAEISLEQISVSDSMREIWSTLFHLGGDT